MKIGPYTLVSPVYVAPMAGVTDAPFRKIAREFGAGLACTEMISSEALVRQHRESFRLMDLGWDFATRNYLEMATRLEATGIQGLAVHGRTRSQRYDPSADWIAIAQVKSAVKIPVAGSGDLRSADDALRRIRESGVDAVMLGRGILGNLWLVRQTVARLTTGEAIPALAWIEQIELVARHCDLVLDYYGAERGPRLLRKFIAWGLRGFRGAARLRTTVQSVCRPEDVREVLERALTIDPGARLDDDDAFDGPSSCEAA